MSKLQRYRVIPEPTGLSRFARLREAIRSYTLGPWSANSPEIGKYFSGGRTVASGIVVNEDNALSYSAVWSAVSLISSQVGSLPLCLYRKLPKGGGKEKYETHPLYRLLHDRPNPEMSSMVFRETLQAHVLTYGNAYAEIERDTANRPIALWPLTPDRVRAVRRNGDLYYVVANPSGGYTTLSPDDTVHIPGLSFDGITGYGVIDKMRESIGLGLATERFGASFFGNGTTFGGVFEHPTKLSPDARKNFIESVNSRHQGVDRAHKFMVVEEGMKYQKFGVDPDHAQFLETRNFQLDEVARWLNLPPHKLKNLLRSTNNNIEHQNLEYYIDCLSPWLNRWEQELSFKLIAASERNLQDIEHIVEGLLRGDSAGRGSFYSQQFNMGGLTANEMRAAENRNNIPGGDMAFVPLTHIPLHLAEPYFLAEIEAKKAPKVAPAPPVDPGAAAATAAAQQRIEALEVELATARRLTQAAEDAKDIAHGQIEARAADLLREQQAHAESKTLSASERELMRAAYAELVTQRDAAVIAKGDAIRLARETEARRTDEAAEAVARYALLHEDRAAVIADRDEYARALGTMTGERDTLSSRVDELTRAVEEAQTATAAAVQATTTATEALAVASAERDRFHEQVEGLSLDLTVAHTERTAADARADVAEKARAIAETVIAELRPQLVSVQADLQQRQAALVEAERLRVDAETRATVTETLRAALAEEVAAQAALLDASHRQLTEAGAAARDVMIDGLTWLIDRETERARRAQGSPEKLRKWVESFYVGHDELCRKILRPSLRAWAVCAGHLAPIDPILDAFVAQHIAQSTQQLRALADDHDAETLAIALEKVCRRWEADRAEQAADRLCREAA